MIKWKWFELDLLENENCTLLERVKAMAIYIWNHAKPNITDTEKLNRWEEVDAQALSTILTPNGQAGWTLKCQDSLDV